MTKSKTSQSSLLLTIVAVLILFGNYGNANEPVPGLKAKIQYCSTCHGQFGGGYRGYYSMPRLAGQTPDYLENQLGYFADHTRDNPASKQFMWDAARNLSQPMRKELASYFSSLNAPPAGGSNGGNEAIGKMIFEQGVPSAQIMACNMCHGQNAEGSWAMPRLAGQRYDYLKIMFEDWRNGYRANAAPMPDIAKALTEAQIEGLAEYLSELP